MCTHEVLRNTSLANKLHEENLTCKPVCVCVRCWIHHYNINCVRKTTEKLGYQTICVYELVYILYIYIYNSHSHCNVKKVTHKTVSDTTSSNLACPTYLAKNPLRQMHTLQHMACNAAEAVPVTLACNSTEAVPVTLSVKQCVCMTFEICEADCQRLSDSLA